MTYLYYLPDAVMLAAAYRGGGASPRDLLQLALAVALCLQQQRRRRRLFVLQADVAA